MYSIVIYNGTNYSNIEVQDKEDARRIYYYGRKMAEVLHTEVLLFNQWDEVIEKWSAESEEKPTPIIYNQGNDGQPYEENRSSAHIYDQGNGGRWVNE